MGNATTGLSSTGLRKVQTLLAQREASTGRPIDKATLEALFESELRASQQTQIQREASASVIKTREEQLKIQREQIAQQEETAKTQGVLDIAQTGITGYVAYKAYGGQGAATIPKLVGVGETTSLQATDVGVAAGGAGTAGTLTAGEAAAAGSVGGGAALPPATGASAVGGESAAGGAGTGVSGVGVGIAAAVIADSAIASSVSGGFSTWEERQAQNIKSFEYGGMTPGSAAILERAGIKSPVTLFEEGTGVDVFQPAEDINEWLGNEIPILDEINDFFQGIGI